MSEKAQTVPGVLANMGQSLISALPPAFLLLCLLNVAFLGAIMWFLNSETGQRTKMVDRMMDACYSDLNRAILRDGK